MSSDLPKIALRDKILATIAFIFPFTEISYYFGAKVFLNTESLTLKIFYLNYVVKLASFYETNVYLIFAVMIGVFIVCSRGTVRLTKFVRFNVIQAVLLNIICSCMGTVYTFLPIVLRESIIGVSLANFLYLGTVIVMVYCALLIFLGRYPKIPILTEAAKLQVQRGYLD